MSSSLSRHNPAFASGGQIVAECLRAFLPPEPVRVSDYAAAHRWLSNEGGGYVGRWNHEQAPYLIAPMDELTAMDKLTVAVIGPGQSGKTEIARNWLFSTALSDPADVLWYSASEPLVSNESKVHINRLIQDHPALRELLRDSSIFFKRFGSMSVQFLAGIMGNLISKSAPRLVLDEFDAIAKAIPEVKALADVRRQTFGWSSMALLLSHPDLATGLEPKDWNAGIAEVFRQSDQRIWYWQCPECGCFSSPHPRGARVMTIHYDEQATEEEIAQQAVLLCPVNGCLIEDGQRQAMNLTGLWVGLGQEIDEEGTVTGTLVQRDTAGFWIHGAMSPFMIGGIGGLAVTRVRAERKYAVDNDRNALHQVLSKTWGVPLDIGKQSDAIDATEVAGRAEQELMLGVVPAGVRFITVMVDVQANRFELLSRGWCADGRSVVVDFRKIEASPGTSADDWDEMLAMATRMAWPLEGDETRGMKATAVGFDSSGAPGVTLQGYEAWKRLKARGGVRLLGRIDGRPVYSVLPMKGGSSLQAPRLQVVFPDARKDRFAPARGEVPIGLFNPNMFKDDLAAQLIIADGGPWSVRFPRALAAPAAPHPWFEQLVAEQRQKNGSWKRVQEGKPNEAMDLMTGTHVLAFMLGINRIAWDRPPQWARPWADNVNVVRAEINKLAEGVKAMVQAVAGTSRSVVEPAPLSGAVRTKPIRLIDRLPVRRHLGQDR